MTKTIATLFGCALAALTGAAAAQDFPSKPVKLVIPFAAGGGADTNMRQILADFSRLLQGQIIIENRPGANGIIASEFVARSAPDGYTILVATNSTHSANPHLYRKLSYDPLKDFESVGLYGETAPVLLKSAANPAASVKEVIELARQKPGALNFAVTNTSSLMATEALKRAAAVSVASVNYKSGPQALTDLVSGQIDFVFGDMATASGLIKGGRVKPLAVTSARRLSAYPEIPTMAESGVPGVEVLIWGGLFAPRGTPREVIVRLNQALNGALRRDDTRVSFAAVGMDPKPSTTDECTQYVARQYEHWGALIRGAGIEPE